MQFIHHARDQAAYGGQFLGTEKLLLHRPLVQQLERYGHLIGQVLRQRLLIGVEHPRTVVLVELQHPHNAILRDHGHEKLGLGHGPGGALLNPERTARRIRHHQRCAVVEAGGHAQLGVLGGGAEGNGDHRLIQAWDFIQCARAPVVDIQPHSRDAQNRRESRGNPLRGGFGRGRTENVLS